MSAQGTSLNKRLAAWFVLAAAVNVTVVFALVLISQLGPLNIPLETSLTFVGGFIRPLYSAELLFFTTVLSLLAALSSQPATDDHAVGNRKIARALQLAMTIILGGAAVMIWAEPASAAFVAFAVLLAFVSYVLADRLAPPRNTSAEQRYLLANESHARRSRWANDALGVGWQAAPRPSSWLVLATYMLCPIVAMTVTGTIYAIITWGVRWATQPTTVVMMALIAFGTILLTFAWMATANKADSPSTRKWTVSVFATAGALTSITFASIFFVADPTTQGLGWLILTVTAVHAMALWLPIRWIGRQKLLGVAATFTSRSLDGSRAARAQALQDWTDEQELTRSNGGFWRRLLGSGV